MRTSGPLLEAVDREFSDQFRGTMFVELVPTYERGTKNAIRLNVML